MNSALRGRESSALPRDEDKRTVVEAMFDRIAGDYERVNRLISLGLDRRWRRQAVERLGLARGALVLDLACGTGDMCRILRSCGYEPIGVDFSSKMLALAGNTDPLLRADVCALPMADGTADGITCAFALRNFVDLPGFFFECARVLRRGGRAVVVDAATPEHPLMRAGHRVWFGHVVPRLGALISEPDAYRYLSASTVYMPGADALNSIATDAGFAHVEIVELTFGAVKLLSATKR